MIGEILIVGLELAILASVNKPKNETTLKVDFKPPKKVEKTKVAERKEPTISNSGERFVQCPLEGYRSYYLIGDWGTVKKVNGRVLKHSKHAGGKEFVFLANGKTQTTFTVERLVALSFLVRPAKGDGKTHKIVHKNGNVGDNRAVNLMWE